MQDATAQSNGEGKTGFLRSCFTRLRMRKGKMSVITSPLPSPKAAPLWSTFQSCHEVTLDGLRRFLTGDKTALIKDGSPPPEAIEDAGLSFWSEYCELRGGLEIVSLIRSSSAIAVLSSKIDRIQTLIECARVVSDEALISALEAEGYAKDCKKMREGTDDEYLTAVNAIESRLKTDRLRLESMAKEREQPKKDNRTEAQKQKEAGENLTMEIAAIEEVLKIPIDEHKVTVDRYCAYYKRAVEKSKPKAQSNGRRTR